MESYLKDTNHIFFRYLLCLFVDLILCFSFAFVNLCAFINDYLYNNIIICLPRGELISVLSIIFSSNSSTLIENNPCMQYGMINVSNTVVIWPSYMQPVCILSDSVKCLNFISQSHQIGQNRLKHIQIIIVVYLSHCKR